MKALSIRQPWAWLICMGIKDIENRDWATSFRGRIYVHAGNRFDTEALVDSRLCHWLDKSLISLEDGIVIDQLHRTWRQGAIIGEVDITDCVWIQNLGLPATKSPWFDGNFGFVLANPVLYKNPIPYKGRTFFFEVDIKEV